MYERTCKRCHKKFARASLTGYLYRGKGKGEIYCGYNCWIHKDDPVEDEEVREDESSTES